MTTIASDAGLTTPPIAMFGLEQRAHQHAGDEDHHEQAFEHRRERADEEA